MKRFITICLALFLALAVAVPASAGFKDMWAQVYSLEGYDASGRAVLTEQTSGITFKVLQYAAAGSNTAETIYEYGDDAYTSLTNPVTTTNYALATVMKQAGVLSFRVDPGESGDRYVTVIVVDTDGGFSTSVKMDEYTHTIVIDERPNVQHSGLIWYSASSAVETDTGIDFRYDTLIEHVGIEAVTVDAGETLDVGVLSSGTNGDADGFVDGSSVATAGHPLITLTTSGALMDDATNFDPDGHVILSANEQSLTYTGSGGSDTAAGYIHYFITWIRR